MSAQDSGTAERRRQFAEEARSERPDLALLCLLLGAEAGPVGPEEPRPVRPGDVSPDPYGIDAAQIELDRLAGLLPYGTRTPAGWASALAELLGERHEFGGSSADYQRLESSLLQQVLRRRRGLPILLSVVWIEVARRAGAPVYGVALPGHFVVGFGDPERPVLVDPFAGGAPLTGEDAELFVTGATGARLEPSMLAPARPLEIVLRRPPRAHGRLALGGGPLAAAALAPGPAALRAGPAPGPARGVPARGGGDGGVRGSARRHRADDGRDGPAQGPGGPGAAELSGARRTERGTAD